MLDENLPTFFHQISHEDPFIQLISFVQKGHDPFTEFILKRPNPSSAKCRGKYGLGLVDSSSPDVVYGEVLIEPDWPQSLFSITELRDTRGDGLTSSPAVPDLFVVRLYNPEHHVKVRSAQGTWNTNESWEFEMPQQTFRRPSGSWLDSVQHDPSSYNQTPKVLFQWKRDSIFSKDLTCFMVGKSLKERENKEPDITVAFFKHRRHSNTTLTIYEPNMQRVDIEDRKGLDIVLLLTAETIKDLFISPVNDPFNITSASGSAASRRNNTNWKSSKLSSLPWRLNAGSLFDNFSTMAQAGNMKVKNDADIVNHFEGSQLVIDAKTRRLQILIEKEMKDHKKQLKKEQKLIKKMLEEEHEEHKKAEIEIAKETERLKKLYGVEGQHDVIKNTPHLPPRPFPS